MIYKQYTSKELNGKRFSKNGEIVVLSIQSRPKTYMKIGDVKYTIGGASVLELDNISLRAHLVNGESTATKFQMFNEDGTPFDGAIIDVLYNNSKEEDLNLES